MRADAVYESVTAEVPAESRRRSWSLKAIIVALVVLILTAPRTLAQPAENDSTPEKLPMPTLHMRLGTGDGWLLGPDGRTYLIPQGSHILAPEYWAKEFDGEMMRLQEQGIRLTAENKSLRESASELPWLPVVIGVAIGITAGVYIGYKL